MRGMVVGREMRDKRDSLTAFSWEYADACRTHKSVAMPSAHADSTDTASAEQHTVVFRSKVASAVQNTDAYRSKVASAVRNTDAYRSKVASAVLNTDVFRSAACSIAHFGLSLSAFALMLLWYCVPALAQTPLRTTLDSTQILIGDQVHLSIETPFQDGLNVAFPSFADTITSQVEVVSARIDTIRPKDGQATLRQVLTLTSFDTGFVVIPPLPVVIGADTFATEPQLIYVADIVIDEAADVKDIEEPLDPPFDWYSLIPYGIGALVLGLIGLLLWYYLNKLKKRPEVALPPAPSEPAHVTALARLEALRQQKLWQADRAKEYHIELTDIIRWYLEQRFGIMALEQTTDEITYAMERQGIDRALIADLRRVLLLADLVKFAKARPISTENEQSMDLVVAFVKATIPAPVTDPKA